MSDFPDVKIKPVKLAATIKYEVELKSTDDIEQAKEDFEDAVDRLRCQGSAIVTWKGADK